MAYTNEIFEEDYVRELIDWTESVQLPKEPFQMTKWIKVNDSKVFLDVDLNLIKKNFPNQLSFAAPAIVRLYYLREYMESRGEL